MERIELGQASRLTLYAGLILSVCVLTAELIAGYSFGLLGDLAMGVFVFSLAYIISAWLVN